MDPLTGPQIACPEALTPAEVVERVRCAGLSIHPDAVTIEHRGERSIAVLPGDRVAWFPFTAEAAKNLRTENRVLSLLGARCSFQIPRVLFSAPEGWTLRSAVPGMVDGYGFAARLKADPHLLTRTANDLGAALAEQHSRVEAREVAGWLRSEPCWPLRRDVIRANLPAVVADADLLGRIQRALTAYDHREDDGPSVLVHSDLGLHNIAFDPEVGTMSGIFDYGDAAVADRHLDFRYLVFSAIPDALLTATIKAYTDAGGMEPRRDRILLCNAVAAISHLAVRLGRDPHEDIAGRNLAQDLTWTRWALQRSGF